MENSTQISTAPIITAAGRRSEAAVSRWLVYAAALLGCLIVSFFAFLLLDVIFFPKNVAPVPLADDNYPRLDTALPEKVELALNSSLAALPDGLALVFDNKLGLSGNQTGITGTTSGVLPPPPASGSTTRSAVAPAVSPSSSAASIPYPVTSYQSQPVAPINESVLPVSEDAADRLNRRALALRRGEAVIPLSEIYDIEDVSPVGVVGNSQSREVLFYAPSTKQTFSVPLRTRFRNGTLDGASISGNVVDGVRFKNERSGESVTRLWSKGKAKKNASAQTAADAPVLSNEPVLTPDASLSKPQVVRRKN